MKAGAGLSAPLTTAAGVAAQPASSCKAQNLLVLEAELGVSVESKVAELKSSEV